MCKRISLILTLILAVFLVVSIAPTFTSFSGSAAYAQGPFGKKQSGGADKQRDQEKKEQEKKEAEKKAAEKREQDKKEAEKKEAEKKAAEKRDTQPTPATGSRRIPDARPTEPRTESQRDDRSYQPAKDEGKEFTRIDERQVEEKPKKYRPGVERYPYYYPEDHGRRNPYPYPIPRPSSRPDVIYSTQELVGRISNAWKFRQPELLIDMLPEQGKIKIYKDGEHLRNLDPDDFYFTTVKAIYKWHTKEFKLSNISFKWNKIVARGYHIYGDKYGDYKNLVYYMLEPEGRNRRWVITETGFSYDYTQDGKEVN